MIRHRLRRRQKLTFKRLFPASWSSRFEAWQAFLTELGARRPQRRPSPFRRLFLDALEPRCVLSLSLTTLEVRTLAETALARWVEAGVTPAQIAALQALDYQVADLGEHNLAQFRQGVITLDDNAA